jgi:L-2,4-diaminobutyrate decarboxylase
LTAFLDGSGASREAFVEAVTAAARTVAGELAGRPRPYSGASPDELDALLGTLPGGEGVGFDQALHELGEQVVRNSIDVAHPRTAAHLHCPPLIASCAAEVVIAATNQSLDSWDQSPAATHVEQAVVDWMTAAIGMGPKADGVFTSGGTQSNLMGLLLARDRAVAALGGNALADGLPPDASRFRIVCAETAHFSLLQSARILGLGDRAIHGVPADEDGRLTAEAASQALDGLVADGLIPICVWGTAGYTDLGTIDPLAGLAEVARAHDAWFHVDAAVGGILVTSERERHRIAGLEQADSVAVDFHKLWFQPISCGAFAVRDAEELRRLLLHADYLNPEPQEDGTAFPNLVDKSLATTRRFDALKLAVALRVHGERFFGEATESLIDLAQESAALVEAEPALELARTPQFTTVLFRHDAPAAERDALNMGIRRDLLLSGEAVIAQTRLAGETWLKLTLMNPQAKKDDVAEILRLVADAGAARLSRPAASAARQAP